MKWSNYCLDSARRGILLRLFFVVLTLMSSTAMMGQGAGTYYRSAYSVPLFGNTGQSYPAEVFIDVDDFGLICDIFYEYEDGKLAWIGFNPYTLVQLNRNYPYSDGYTCALGWPQGIYDSNNRRYRYPSDSRSFLHLIKGKYVPEGKRTDYTTSRDVFVQQWLTSYGYIDANEAGTVYFGETPDGDYSARATNKILDQFGDGTSVLQGPDVNNRANTHYWILPNCIKKIANNAFSTSFIQSIYEDLYLYGINLDNIESIGDNAFKNCALLRCVNNEGLRYIYRTFTFDLQTVTSIGNYAFQNCSSIPGIIIYTNVDPAGQSHQFQDCTGMTTAEFAGDATEIPAYFFGGCTALTTVKMDRITKFKDYCFDGCTSLHFDELELQDKTVGHSPFRGVSADWMHVKNTTIAEGNSILTGLVNSNVFIDEDEVQDYTKFVSDGLNSSVTIYVPCDLLADYKNADGWSSYADQITSIPGCGEPLYVLLDGVEYYEGVEYVFTGPNTLMLKSIGGARSQSATTLGIPQSFTVDNQTLTVTAVGSSTVSGVCANIPFTNVSLSSTVKTIGTACFAGSSSMTTINLNNVQTIYDAAFVYCTNLDGVNLNQVVTLGGNAFYSCSSLSSASMNSLTTITGQSAFQNCTSLETVTLGSGLKEIPNSTFNGCSALESINLNNIEIVGQFAFFNCSSLLSINLSAVTSIQGGAFLDCSSLTTVSPLNSALREVSPQAFMNCSSLNTIDLSNLTTIGLQAFYNSGLTEITLNSELNSFEEAFKNSTHLETVNLNGSLVDKQAFMGCTALENIVFRSDMSDYSSTFKDEAFSGCTSLETFDLLKARTIGDYCFDGCTSLKVALNINNDNDIFFGKEPFRGVTFTLLVSTLGNLYDYDSSTGNINPDLIDNAVIAGAKNSTIHFTDKENLYDIDEYLNKNASTGEYVIEEDTYIYVHRDIWDDYQSATGWADVKGHILTWPPYDFYVIKDDVNYLDVDYELNEDGENTLTLTYVNPDIKYAVTKMEIPQTMTLTPKRTTPGEEYTGEPTTFTVTRIGDNVFNGFDFSRVILPSTVTTIGERAFNSCSSLENINLNHVKVYGDQSFQSCYDLAIHLDLRNATSIGSYAFASSGLKSAWVGKVTGERMFQETTNPMNIYIAEEDPTQVNAEHVTTYLHDASVVYVICRNITTSENLTNPNPNNTNPLQLFHDNASWGDPDVWKYVYPMLHQETAGEREKTYTTFSFDKPIDFRGTDEDGNNIDEMDEYGNIIDKDGNIIDEAYYYYYYDNILNKYFGINWSEDPEYDYATYGSLLKSHKDLAIRGMLQFYKETDNNSSGFKDNRIQALVVTGFNYTPATDLVPESGQIFTEPAGVRPAMTGVLIKWHPGEEYHGATGMSDYYPLPPVRRYGGDGIGYRMTENDFQEQQQYYQTCKIRTGTFENSRGEVNTGGRNLERLEEGDGDGQYKDNYVHKDFAWDENWNLVGVSGTTTLVNGVYQGRDYDNLMIGNTIRLHPVFYNPWYYNKVGDQIDHSNKDYDRRYKQMGLNVSCYFRRFYNENEPNSEINGGTNGSYMRAYRAFLRLPLEIDGEETNSGAAPMMNALFTIGGSPDDETTGIDHVTNTGNVRTENNVIYSLDGKKVSNDGLEGLPKGIYIINGRKVVKK